MLDRLEDSFKAASRSSPPTSRTTCATPINNLLGEAQVALSRPREAAEYCAVLESPFSGYERSRGMLENMLFLRPRRTRAARARAAVDRPARGAGKDSFLLELLAEERNIRLALEVAPSEAGSRAPGRRADAQRAWRKSSVQRAAPRRPDCTSP